MPYKNLSDRRAQEQRRYAKNGAAMRATASQHYAANGDRIRAARALKRTPEAKAAASAKQRARYAALRLEMLTEYGGTCACCGESEPKFLELDHAGDDGAEHRRQIGRGSHRTYRVLKLAGWPKDEYRLLCANCNQGRARNGGVCPHVAVTFEVRHGNIDRIQA